MLMTTDQYVLSCYFSVAMFYSLNIEDRLPLPRKPMYFD